MVGEIQELEDDLWLIAGEMPKDNFKKLDIANVLMHRADDRLYLIDTVAPPPLMIVVCSVGGQKQLGWR
jgi:hypothetical protein